MPTIDQIKPKKNIKFKKKEYRAWDNNSIKTIEKEDKSLKISNEDDIKDEKTSYIGTISKTKKPDDSLDLRKVKRSLHSTQLNILKYLLNNIEYQDDEFNFFKPLFYVKSSEALDVPISSLKSHLNRLKKLKLIELVDFKPGIGGYCCFKMNNSILKFLKETTT